MHLKNAVILTPQKDTRFYLFVYLRSLALNVSTLNFKCLPTLDFACLLSTSVPTRDLRLTYFI